MGSSLVSNLNCLKRVSLINKFDNTKFTWWIKLSSVNSGFERLNEISLECLKLLCLYQVNIEVQSRTFGGVEKISRCEKGKKLFIY